MLLAAGYDPKKYDKPNFSEACTLHMLGEIVDMFKKQGVSIIGDGGPTGYRYTYNIFYTKDCSTIKTYYVNYIPTFLNHTIESRCREYFLHLCGLLAKSNKPGPIKAIIITNSMKVFSEISKAKAPQLAVYLSAVLIDPIDFKPFMEKPLETAFRISEEIEKFSLAPNQ